MVSASLTLNSGGKVTRVAIDSPLGGSNLGNCVEAELRKLAFKRLMGSKFIYTVKVVIRK